MHQHRDITDAYGTRPMTTESPLFVDGIFTKTQHILEHEVSHRNGKK